MKVRIELIHGNKSESTVVSIGTFSEDSITEQLKKLPKSFIPVLANVSSEDNQIDKKSPPVISYYYRNSKKVHDMAIIRVVPMFGFLELLSDQASAA